MATIDSPTQQGVSAEVEATFGAARVVQRPYDYIARGTGGQVNVGGHYAYSNSIAPLAYSPAGANVWGFRNRDPQLFSVIHRIYLSIQITAAVTAQALGFPTLYRVSGFTADMGTASIAQSFTLLGARANMNQSPNVSIYYTQLAAGMALPAGSTLGTSLISITLPLTQATSVVGACTPVIDVYNAANAGPMKHPMVLANNEGLLLQWGAAIATGTIGLMVGVEWAQVAAF